MQDDVTLPEGSAVPDQAKASHTVHFTLDGRPLTSPTAHEEAGEILRSGGLDPAGYDLARLNAAGKSERPYGDDHRVHVREGDRFLSVRQSAQVA